jgi:hypothetical protein
LVFGDFNTTRNLPCPLVFYPLVHLELESTPVIQRGGKPKYLGK